MIKIYMVIIYLFLIIGLQGQAQVKNLYRTDNGFVKFTSDAPLELIQAESHELKGLVDPVKRTFAFQINIKSLQGFNSPLQQEHFYENYMETEKYPTASFSGKIIENVDFNVPGKQVIRAKGILNIHGVKEERIIKCDLDIKEDSFAVKSEFDVPLSEHNFTIPKLVYQKIAEVIKVQISAELIKEKP